MILFTIIALNVSVSVSISVVIVVIVVTVVTEVTEVTNSSNRSQSKSKSMSLLSPGLHKFYQPGSLAVRKWRENEKKEETGRE